MLKILTILSIIYCTVPPNTAIIFKFTNIQCESYNKSLVVFSQCRLRAIKRNHAVCNVNATFLRPINDISVKLVLQKKANGYKPFLFDVTIDCCRFIKHKYNPAANIVFNLFREFSNVNHTCPYSGEQIVSGFYLKPEVLNLVLPTGEYRLLMTWIFYNQPAFHTNAYFSYIEDLKDI